MEQKVMVMTELEENQTAKPKGKGYIATAEIDEEEIGYFGEGETPAEALKWFDVNEYISSAGLESGDVVEIGVFKAIYNGSEEWKKGEYRDEFAWVLGEQVYTKLITVNLDESGEVFKRELRYMVAKQSDITAALDEHQQGELSSLLEMVEGYRINSGKRPLQCVVVERDWPNYADTWAAIERISTGNTATVENVLEDMAKNAADNGHQSHSDALNDAIQRMYDEGLFQHKYYCECSAGCGNSYQEVKVNTPCLDCGQGTMQAQDVEPWG